MQSHEFFTEPSLVFFTYSLKTPPLTPQSTIFGLVNQKENFLIINDLLFIFTFYTSNSRLCGKLDIEYLKAIIYKTKNTDIGKSMFTS